MKRYDLMHQINTRGTFAHLAGCHPAPAEGQNPHILNNSPPLNMEARWFAPHVAYTMAKYGMSMCVLGMAERAAPQGHRGERAVAAHRDRHRGGEEPARRRGDQASRTRARDHGRRRLRHPHASPARETTGNFFIDEDVLKQQGVTDFDKYAVDPTAELFPDFFV
jgi:citronellol/citronellal dehydrogenase